jgi:glucose-1-phosphate thymidylyltransferase
MKALVLAGGRGSRLRPFSHTTPKQLVPVGNRPAVFYGLDALRDVDVKQVAIVVGQYGGHLERAVGSGSRFGLDVTYVPQRTPGGLADCVRIASDLLGSDDFVLYPGDCVIPGGIEPLVRRFRTERPDALVMVSGTPRPGPHGVAHGVAHADESGAMLEIRDTARSPYHTYPVIGPHVFSAAIHQAVLSIRPNWRGELDIGAAVQWLVDHGYPVAVDVHTGAWCHTGDIDGLLDCNRTLLRSLVPELDGKVDDASEVSGPVLVELGATVSRSRITGPVVVGSGTVVVDSELGPYTAVGDDCVLEGARIEDSIVLGGAWITASQPIHGSVIGANARVHTASSPRDGARLFIGDHCRVHLVSSS